MRVKNVFLYAIFLFLNQKNISNHFEKSSFRTVDSLKKYLDAKNYSVLNSHDLAKGSLGLYKEMTQSDGVQLIISGIKTVDINQTLTSLLVGMEYQVTIFAGLPSGDVFKKNYYVKMETQEPSDISDETLDVVISESERLFFRRLQK